MKKFARKKCRKIFLEAIFSHLRKLFHHKIFVITLPIVFQSIIIQKFDVSFALVLHFLH